MNVKIALTCAALIVAPAVAAQAGCAAHDKQAMSCADGSIYDAETNSCVPLASS